MSDNRSLPEANAVQLQPLLVEALAARRDANPDATKFQRRLEGRELYVRGDRARVREFLDRFLEAGAPPDAPKGSLELSLIAYELLAAHARRPGPGRGCWLRLTLRREGDEGTSYFDRPGIPFLSSCREVAESLSVHCAHHAFSGHSLAQLHFPILDPPPGRPALAAPARILFVDDDAMILEVHRQSIESLGYDVVECADPRGALELFERHPDAFDVVLSDRSMPSMDGGELAQRLRTIRPSIPIVLSTGLASDESGPHDVQHLAKPFTMEELSRCLARAGASREERDAD